MTCTNSMAIVAGTGDAQALASGGGVAGTCLYALAHASIPRRSKTDLPMAAPDWCAESMSCGRSVSYTDAASCASDDFRLGGEVFFCLAPKRARDCADGP